MEQPEHLHRRSHQPRRLPIVPIALLLIAFWLVYREYGGYLFAPRAEPRVVSPRGDLSDDEKTTIQIFQNAAPSVVFITSLEYRSDVFGTNVMEIPAGTGSGFVWDSAGHVVTNFHVIKDASAAKITLNNHQTFTARLVGVEPDKDLAVLRINAPPSLLQPIPIGESHNLQVGQKVFAIGNPFGLDQTLTTGVVSALGRSIQSVTGRTIQDVVQTDAAINPGNSGGPLLDSAGRLIGVNTSIYSPSGASAGIGFAVPVDTVNRVVPQLVQHGKVTRPRLGIMTGSDNLARQLRIRGVLILQVEPNTGAAAAGLRGTRRARDGTILFGDIITAINDTQVASQDELLNALEKCKVGDTVTVTIQRDDTTMTAQVTLQ